MAVHHQTPPGLALPDDHPGANDPEYRSRRGAIAAVGAAYHPGDPIPDVTYTAEEDAVWAQVSAELGALHRNHAVDEYRRGAAARVLPTDRGPQLRAVDPRGAALPGFRIRPVPGLVPTDVFYGALAERAFLATQYIRHHSVPHYTPEPDIVHEILGHANMLASPVLADLYEAAGRASVRSETPEALEFFSRVFWFTLEFGVVHERGDLKAFGAGILSSFGEMETYRNAEIRPWDLAAMGTQGYDITRYQPVLFAATSVGRLIDDLTDFFDRFDADTPARLTAGTTRAEPAEPVVDCPPAHHQPDVTTGGPIVDTLTEPTTAPAEHLLGWDSIELWVGNARSTAGFLISSFGFTCTGYAGPETGVRDRVSYVLDQGAIRLVVTGALGADSPITAHVSTHGDGVHDLAWLVDDAPAAFEAAVARGARPIREPWTETDEHGTLSLATVATYGETQHTFVDRSAYRGPSLAPGYHDDDLLPDPVAPEVGLTAVDHVVGNVEKGRLDDWVTFYESVLGFAQLVHFDDDQISTEYSSLMSTVVWDGNRIVLPINEPADGRGKSQIQEYVEAYDGPGVQHLALATDDIVATVEALRRRGVRFMRVPDAYYVEAKERLADIDLPWTDLQRLNILVDRDEHGHLLQIFTETVMDRPTVFFEIIQRQGATGFGAGNFKALFEAIERDQARRGNL